MKLLAIIATPAAMLLLAGCAATKISLPPYVPTGTQEIRGDVAVNDFQYSPKAKVPADVIHNTAAGEIKLTEPVAGYVTNAIRREFRQAGLSIKPGNGCTLSGEIRDLTIDDLGFSATYLSDFHYVLASAGKTPLLDVDYQVKFDTTKYVVAEVIFANINKVISSNIDKLMSSDGFQKAVGGSCGK